MLDSNTIMLAMTAFLSVLGIGVLLTFGMNRKKHSKNVDRLLNLREVSDDEIMRMVTDESNYSELIRKYALPFIRNNKETYSSLLKAFGINLNELSLKISRAGEEDNMTATDLAAKKIFGTILMVAFMLIGVLVNYAFCAIGILIYYMWAIAPYRQLDKKYEERRYEFQQAMPFYLKMVTAATEVGYPIEKAVEFVNSKHKCIVQEEFDKAVQETEFSNDWIAALTRRSFYADIEEFEQFVSEVRICKEKGAPITEVLKALAAKIEKESVITYEEKANAKSSSITFPIFAFLFFPAIAIIVVPMFDSIMGVI